MASVRSDEYDGPWKEALERFLPEALALFVPEVHAAIDWSARPRILDTELAKIAPKSARGRRTLDKLFEVLRREGGKARVLIHLEAQHQPEKEFDRRMFGYHVRLIERYDRPVFSLALLGDENAGWRPGRYRSELWSCRLEFGYPVVKLLDYRERLAELEAERNPFAAVVLAHLAAIASRRDPAGRLRAKIGMVRRLYDKGYGRSEITGLFRLIDWLLRLPDDLDDEVMRTIAAIEKERNVSYVTSVERLAEKRGKAEGKAEGEAKGKAEGLAIAIEVRFGSEARSAARTVRKLRDGRLLDAIAKHLMEQASLEEIAALMDTA